MHLELSQSLPYLFYMIGLNTYNPYVKTNLPSCRIRLSTLLLAAFIFIAALITFYAQYVEHTHRSLVIINIAAVSFVFCELITCIAIVYASLTSRQRTQQFWQQFNAVLRLFRSRFAIEMDMRHLYRAYFCEITTISIIHLTHLAVNIAFNYGTYDIVVKTMSMALFTVALLMVFQILYYVRLLLHAMLLVNEKLAEQAKQVGTGSDNEWRMAYSDVWTQKLLVDNFRFIKQMHYVLWEISVIINHLFGWLVIVLFLLNAFDSVHTVYWMVWYLDRNEYWAKTKLLSKYYHT